MNQPIDSSEKEELTRQEGPVDLTGPEKVSQEASDEDKPLGWSWRQTIPTGAGLAILAVFCLLIFGFLLFIQNFLAEKDRQQKTIEANMEMQNLLNKKVASEKKEAVSVPSISNKMEISEINTGKTVLIKTGMIKWQEPQEMGDLGLTTAVDYAGGNTEEEDNFHGSQGVKYVLSGQVASGQYQGGEFYVVSSTIYEGPSVTPDFFRVIKKDNRFIFLGRDLDEYRKEIIKKYFVMGGFDREINGDILIEELEYPEIIYGDNERQKLVKNNYDETFFTSAKLKEAFTHKQLGKVWTTDEKKAISDKPTPFELNSYSNDGGSKKEYRDRFGRFGFYIQAPDGTAVSYRAEADIFAGGEDRWGVLSATWDDGQRNKVEYEKNPSGCGSGEYVYNETLNLTIEENLIPVGKTDKGDILYGYKDPNQPGFDKLYDEIYWVEAGQQKQGKEDFLKVHPKVFWTDPFGRLLAFYKVGIISPAECGKPVIYLYPENKMDVSVQVKPGRGISISDPLYDKGWRVSAEPSGLLYNYADEKNYPYLFWEGQGDVPYETPKMGFVVSRNEVGKFLDEKLSQLGLIEKEIKDFKEFWIPQMEKEKQPYLFVTFLSKSFIDKLAPLEIEPQPETVIRVLMDYYGMDQRQPMPSFSIKTPERKGFTVVEWGGMLKGKK